MNLYIAWDHNRLNKIINNIDLNDIYIIHVRKKNEISLETTK